MGIWVGPSAISLGLLARTPTMETKKCKPSYFTATSVTFSAEGRSRRLGKAPEEWKR